MFGKILQMLSISCKHKNTSQPFAAMPSQSPNPGAQTNAQAPPEQVACATLGARHDARQAPQLRASEKSGVSHPLTALPSQSPQPGSHWPRHLALTH